LRHDKKIKILHGSHTAKARFKYCFHRPAHPTYPFLLYPGKQRRKNAVTKFLGTAANVKLT